MLKLPFHIYLSVLHRWSDLEKRVDSSDDSLCKRPTDENLN